MENLAPSCIQNPWKGQRAFKWGVGHFPTLKPRIALPQANKTLTWSTPKFINLVRMVYESET